MVQWAREASGKSRDARSHLNVPTVLTCGNNWFLFCGWEISGRKFYLSISLLGRFLSI